MPPSGIDRVAQELIDWMVDQDLRLWRTVTEQVERRRGASSAGRAHRAAGRLVRVRPTRAPGEGLLDPARALLGLQLGALGTLLAEVGVLVDHADRLLALCLDEDCDTQAIWSTSEAAP